MTTEEQPEEPRTSLDRLERDAAYSMNWGHQMSAATVLGMARAIRAEQETQERARRVQRARYRRKAEGTHQRRIETARATELREAARQFRPGDTHPFAEHARQYLRTRATEIERGDR